MSKLPRDISGRTLAKKLKKFGYEITRETGSHIRLSTNIMGYPHHITIPDHKSLKTGTLNNILKDMGDYLKKEKRELIETLFEDR
jgi:predicted RNA binding protein YcfA (HicA-like mRNA interferase family)